MTHAFSRFSQNLLWGWAFLVPRFPFWFFFFLFFFFLSFVFCLFRAALSAYGGSQTRGQIGAIAAGLRHSYNNASSEQATPVTYATAHSNSRSLTHWERPGIEPASSWILVRFVNHWAITGTPWVHLFWT